MSDPLTNLVIGWEEGEIESLAKGWLAPMVNADPPELTEAQEDLLVAASPVFVNVIIARFLAKQQPNVPPEG